MTFDEFRDKFSKVAMKRVANNADELRLIQPADGRCSYIPAPVSPSITLASGLPVSEDCVREAKYIWVIDDTEVPHSLAFGEYSDSLISQEVKHSNLTGGAPAYFGGEMWFIDSTSVIVNFCSGRYGAGAKNSPEAAVEAEKMQATVGALIADGYRVATTGEDIESGYLSSTVLTGPLVWQES